MQKAESDNSEWVAEWLRHSVSARFVPALIVWPMWLYVMYSRELWSPSFLGYYPMAVAMAFGSLIAGATPLGGGAIAFPVTVLFIGFTPREGRDYTVLIQSFGMPAAAYVLCLQRRDELNLALILGFVCSGTPGVICGLWLSLPSYLTNLVYTVMVLEFAIVLLYSKDLISQSKGASPVKSRHTAGGTHSLESTVSQQSIWWRRVLAISLMLPAGFLGGVLTASVGMGSDIMLYWYGLYGWNLLLPAEARTDVSHTASSVVVMAILSVVTSALRLSVAGIEPSVFLCFSATVWLVVVGAPLGSVCLTPRRSSCLRGLFYVLAVLQFASFAILKIKYDQQIWAIIAVLTLTNVTMLAAHYCVLSHCDACDQGKELRAPRPTQQQRHNRVPEIL